ncbi:MAG: response regulator [Kiritimatiellae bacterium]|nr:response regulator [Kiritimatiellia bacterium]
MAKPAILKILLAEDEPGDAVLVRNLVAGAFGTSVRFELVHVGTLQAALDTLAAAPFDVMLLDLGLPDSQGLETFRKTHARAQDLPIIVMSGLSDETVAVRAVQEGAQDYVVKGNLDEQMLARTLRYSIERKRNEVVIRRLNDELEHAVQERTAELVAERDRARAMAEQLKDAYESLQATQTQLIMREKLASVGQLAAGIAHELNNPVGFILNNFSALRKSVEVFTDLLGAYRGLAACAEKAGACTSEIEALKAREKATSLDFILGDMRELFNDTREGIDRVTAILDAMRDFSRPDRKQELGPYKLNRGVETTLTIARNVYKYCADVKLDLKPVREITASPNQVNQVLLNLIVNAAQAIGEQNRKQKGRIVIRTYEEGPFVCCSVADDGPGIPKDIQAKIFDPFFTTKKPGKGTGLGLSISYDIARKHGGELCLESEPGKGTCFVLKLPLSMDDEEADRLRAPIQEAADA